MEKTLYEQLEISEIATQYEIKIAFHKLATKYHHVLRNVFRFVVSFCCFQQPL